jgi:hypothetical protein
MLRRIWSGWKQALILVKPETVARWHRPGLKLYWTWLSTILLVDSNFLPGGIRRRGSQAKPELSLLDLQAPLYSVVRQEALRDLSTLESAGHASMEEIRSGIFGWRLLSTAGRQPEKSDSDLDA